MSEGIPDLPRFARDVRVTGPDSGPAGTPGPWAGVGRRFGGLLDPGLAGGDWPPATLSHLALGSILGDALQPPASPEPSGESSRGRPDEDTDATAEPTVREIVRYAGDRRASPAGGESEPDARSSAVPTEPTAFEGDSSSTLEAPGSPVSPQNTGGDALASIPELGTSAAPRTVLRHGDRGPTRVTEREITQVLEGTDDAAGGGESGPADPAGDSPQPDAGRPAAAAERSEVSSWRDAWPTIGSSDGWAPPLDLTMPAVPPALGAGASDAAGPPMTVRRRSTATDEAGVGQQPASEGAAAGDVSTEPEAAARGDRESPQARAAGVSDASDAGIASLLDGLEPGEPDAVHRTIADAVSRPRVIDRLYHELERRRRIERERGGRR